LKAKPATSNRQIGGIVKADDNTVAKVRTELEATAEIPQLKKVPGKDGKARLVKAKKKLASPAPIKAAIDAEPETKPNSIAAAASRRALGEFKVACDFWFSKINRDDRQAAITHFCKVAGLRATDVGAA
jgi:hypothetical protein